MNSPELKEKSNLSNNNLYPFKRKRSNSENRLNRFIIKKEEIKSNLKSLI